MNADQLSHWFAVVGIEKVSVGHGWVQGSCPLAPYRHPKGTDSRPSFGAEIAVGESRVYCLSCSFSGSQTELLTELARRGHDFNFRDAINCIIAAEDETDLGGEIPEYESILSAPNMIEYPESLLDHLEPAYCEGQVHPYLIARGVSFETAKILDLRYDPYRARIVFPVRDFNGFLRGLHGRAVGKSDLPYLAYPFAGTTNLMRTWFGEHLVDREKPVVLVESVFDYTSVFPVYPNLLSPLRATVTALQLSRTQWASSVVTFMDGDPAGDKARKKIREGLRVYGIKVRHVVPPLGTDPGDLSQDHIRQLLPGFLFAPW